METDILVGGDAPRVLLVHLMEAVLRAEHGVVKTKGRDTGYYSGRRAGFIAAGARACADLYGCDYDLAKSAISEELKQVVAGSTQADLIDPVFVDQAAIRMASQALLHS